MRIAYITSRYPTVSHTFVLREVQALRRLGVDVRTVTVARPGAGEVMEQDREESARTWAIRPVSAARLARENAATAVRFPRAYARAAAAAWSRADGLGKDRAWALAYFVQAVRLWRWAARTGVDHLHAHFANVGSDVALLAATLGQLTGRGPRTWSFTMHGPAELAAVEHFRLAEKVRAAGFVACISDYCASQLMALVDETHWDKLAVIHCGIDPDAYVRPDAPASAGAPVRVLCVGRLAPVKAHVLLIEAIAALRAGGRDVRLTLIGDGPRRAAIQDAVARVGLEPYVELTGALGQDAVRAHLHAADIFCLPSFAEGVPVVLMEAMASSVPVIATAITGVPELVDDGHSGLLIRPGRRDQLLDALGKLVDDSALRARLGAAGREAVVRSFTSEQAAQQLRHAFATSTAEPPTPQAQT
jgi:glycosyltransferase involved in cell wall biosynthesis